MAITKYLFRIISGMWTVTSLITYFLLAITCTILFALLEIQIEGKDGWASKLPTWKIYFKNKNPNTPLTGYHTYTWLLLFLIPHIAFLFIPWSFGKELVVISFYLFIIIFEDFLWFVFNPNFGIKKFKKEYIPWHPVWLGPLPIQYYFGFILWGIIFWLTFIIK